MDTPATMLVRIKPSVPRLTHVFLGFSIHKARGWHEVPRDVALAAVNEPLSDLDPDGSQKVFDVKEVEEAKVIEAEETRIADPAGTPLRPAQPRRINMNADADVSRSSASAAERSIVPNQNALGMQKSADQKSSEAKMGGLLAPNYQYQEPPQPPGEGPSHETPYGRETVDAPAVTHGDMTSADVRAGRMGPNYRSMQIERGVGERVAGEHRAGRSAAATREAADAASPQDIRTSGDPADLVPHKHTKK